MKRYHEELHVGRRRVKEFKNLFHSSKKTAGHYRKKSAFDCGNSQCHLCHSDKFPKREPTKQELESTEDLQYYQGQVTEE